MLVSSAELAEQGKLTGDLAVVANEFAEQYPDVVQTWLEQENRAVELYRSDPRQGGRGGGARSSRSRRPRRAAR